MKDPYAPPATTAGSAHDPATSAYKPAETLTRWARILVGTCAVMSVGQIFESLYEMRLIDQLRADGMEVDDFYLALGAGSMAYVTLMALSMLSAFVVGGFWIYRVTHNARALVGQRHLRSTPLGAVGWYFIPVLNLWKPYQALKDVWLASHHGHSDREVTGALLPTWWAFWLISSIIGDISTRAMWNAETFAQEYTALILSIVESAFNIPACLAFIRIMGHLQAAQLELKATQDAVQENPTPAAPP